MTQTAEPRVSPRGRGRRIRRGRSDLLRCGGSARSAVARDSGDDRLPNHQPTALNAQKDSNHEQHPNEMPLL